eukprot:TRINITY_DN1492_c0_g1_i1.p1 TRINITY_DN1492_c0_g1~~TRINITY_DN1492_c0_g1_i1.p1  ORF type:complete len:255 (+),score=31.82 TRINITY_DN1492_c0_g1_i1:66-830(+)
MGGDGGGPDFSGGAEISTLLGVVGCIAVVWVVVWMRRRRIEEQEAAAEADEEGGQQVSVADGGDTTGAHAATAVAIMEMIPRVAIHDLKHKGPCCVCLEGGEQAVVVSPCILKAQEDDDGHSEAEGGPLPDDGHSEAEGGPLPGKEPADEPEAKAEQRAGSPENMSPAPESPTPAPLPDAPCAPSPVASPHCPYGTQQSPVAHAEERPWALIACAELHPIHWDCLRGWLESRSQLGLPLSCPSCRSAISPAVAP